VTVEADVLLHVEVHDPEESDEDQCGHSHGRRLSRREVLSRGSSPSWRANAEGTGRDASTRRSDRRKSRSDPPAVPTKGTDRSRSIHPPRLRGRRRKRRTISRS
jgi:hypothetical protein